MIAKIIPIKRIPVSIAHLDYTVPNELISKISIGQLVEIPFRSNMIFGIVKSIETNSLINPTKIKPLSKIIFTNPLISQKLINFFIEISEFYKTPIGFILKTSILPLQKRKLPKIENQITKINENKEIKIEKPVFHTYHSEQELKTCLKKNITDIGQTLILVPTINQIANISNTLEEKEMITINGQLSDKEYFDKWCKIRSSPDIIVIGTRKALFLPWTNLTSINIIDEGNSDYKSWDMSPRIHTRDAAMILSKHTKAKINLISATPSIETYYFTKNKVYKNNGIVKNITEPSPIFINPTIERRGGNFSSISTEIIEHLKNLSGDSYLMLNRFGTANCVICNDCNFIFKCKNCKRPQTYYEKNKLLICHFCKTEQKIPMNCPNCKKSNFQFIGAGIEGIAKQLKEKLKGINKEIIICDKKNPDSLQNLNSSNDKIIIGTKFAWNQINWSKIKLFTLIDPDIAFILSEYRAIEDLWQTIRSAQEKLTKNAYYYIQTNRDDHSVFQGIYNPIDFYEKEIKERRLFNYPPHKFLLKLSLGHSNKITLEENTSKLFNQLSNLTKEMNDVIISGPITPSTQYYKKQFWTIILIKLSYQNYKKTTKNILKIVPTEWKIDPNPENILSCN